MYRRGYLESVGECATDGELTFTYIRVYYRSVARMSDCRDFAILLSDSNKQSWMSAVPLLSCPSPLQVVSRKYTIYSSSLLSIRKVSRRTRHRNHASSQYGSFHWQGYHHRRCRVGVLSLYTIRSLTEWSVSGSQRRKGGRI